MSAAKFDILQLAETGQAESVLREMRVRALWSPYYLGKVILGYSKLQPHLHLVDSEAFVERWADGETRQWIEWPRAFYKTTLYTITTSMWGVTPHNEDDASYAVNRLGISEEAWNRRMSLHDQDATQLIAFETKPNASKKIKQIRWHYEENELFRALFPEIAYEGSERPWTDDHLKCRRVGERRREDEGTFEGIGVGGTLQSRHYSRMWLDDLVGKAARDSIIVMQDTIEWFGLLYGAFESARAEDQVRFGISNRWGYADLNSHVRRTQPDVRFYTRSAIEINPETGQEISVCPEILTIEDLEKIRREQGRYDFACQYLNMPFAPGDQEIDLALLHQYTVDAETGTLTCSCGVKWRPSQMHRVQCYDPYNAKGNNSRSCPATGVLGISPDDHIFLLEYSIYKGSYAKVFEKIYDMNDKWRPHIFTYEDVGGQNMAEFHIRKMQQTEEFKKRHKQFAAFLPIPTRGKAMELRVRDYLFPLIRNGRFSVRKNASSAFTQNLETFPAAMHDHDYDLLDMCAQAPFALKRPLTAEEIDQSSDQDTENLNRLGNPYTHVEAA